MNNPTFTVASPSDADAINALANEIWPDVYRDMISNEQINYMLDLMYEPGKIRDEIHTGIIYLLIRMENTTIGFAAFGPAKTGESCFIHKIYVAPAHHRQGIGKTTLDEIEKRVSETGASGMELRVNRHNEGAIALYQKAGFVMTGENCADIGNGFLMDDYLFSKPFQSKQIEN